MRAVREVMGCVVEGGTSLILDTLSLLLTCVGVHEECVGQWMGEWWVQVGACDATLIKARSGWESKAMLAVMCQCAEVDELVRSRLASDGYPLPWQPPSTVSEGMCEDTPPSMQLIYSVVDDWVSGDKDPFGRLRECMDTQHPLIDEVLGVPDIVSTSCECYGHRCGNRCFSPLSHRGSVLSSKPLTFNPHTAYAFACLHSYPEPRQVGVCEQSVP